MKTYVWVTFAFMGWAYYEMSGGAGFVPEEQPILVAEADVAPAPDVVTRGDTTTLLTVSTSNRTEQPGAVIVPASAPVAAAAPQIEVEEPVITPVVAPAITPAFEPKLDIREVAGSRVNMRMGPGTDFEVITTLNGGAALEVLSVNADGWANVMTVDRGIEGWMAERLLTDATQ